TCVACDNLHLLIGQRPAAFSGISVSAQGITDYHRLDLVELAEIRVTVIVFYHEAVDDYPVRIVLAHGDDRRDACQGDYADYAPGEILDLFDLIVNADRPVQARIGIGVRPIEAPDDEIIGRRPIDRNRRKVRLNDLIERRPLRRTSHRVLVI